MKITKINLSKDNRMLRIGFGKNSGKWFIRIDLWWIGLRLENISIKPILMKFWTPYRYFTEDGVLMEEGLIMWRICDSEKKHFKNMSRVMFHKSTGYNGGDFRKNPFHENHRHFWHQINALTELEKANKK